MLDSAMAMKRSKFKAAWCVALTCLSALGGPSIALALEATLQPSKQSFSAGDDLKLWLTLINSGSGCEPLFVDPVFSTGTSPVRPQTVVTLGIFDRSRKKVSPRSATEGDASAMRPYELILLPCGTSYGYEISLAKIQ